MVLPVETSVAKYHFLNILGGNSCPRFVEAFFKVSLEFPVNLVFLNRRMFNEDVFPVRQGNQRVRSALPYLISSDDRTERIDTLIPLLVKVGIGEFLTLRLPALVACSESD